MLEAALVAIVVLSCPLSTSLGLTLDSQQAENTKYPTRESVVKALRDADYVLRRFEEVTGEINFGRWNAPYSIVEEHQKVLADYRSLAKGTRSQTPLMEADHQLPGAVMVTVYIDLWNIKEYTYRLMWMTEKYRGDSDFLAKLPPLYDLATEAISGFNSVLIQQLAAEYNDLRACRGHVGGTPKRP